MGKGLQNNRHRKVSRSCSSVARAFQRNDDGAVLVEAAVALPLLLALMLGIVGYGSWMMSAHSVQLAANEAARAALVGINQAERNAIINASVANSVLADGTVEPGHIAVQSSRDGFYLKVTVRYDFARSGLAMNGLVPTPAEVIERSAIVRLTTL